VVLHYALQRPLGTPERELPVAEKARHVGDLPVPDG